MSEKFVTYSAQNHIIQNYNSISPFLSVTYETELELPYYNICFARKTFKDEKDEGTYSSFWKEDIGKEWENTLAFSLINDPLVKIGKSCGILVNEETGEETYALDYYLIYYDYNHYMNNPTKFVSISDATNVSTTVVVELVFSFEDGYVLPVYKTFVTGGSYSLSFADITKELISDLEDCNKNEDVFFFDCPNVTINEDEIKIIVTSELSGNNELFFSNDRFGWHDIKRALSSIRIVDIKEEIQ